MSPQLKLKPVKIDENETSAPRNDSRPAHPSSGNRGPRPNFERPEGGERQNRDSQPRPDRGPRPERTEGGDRGPRNDRFSGRDRDRGPRNDRHDRHGGSMAGRDAGAPPREGGDRHSHHDRDRNRNRSEGFSNSNESAAASEGVAPVANRPAPFPTPDHGGPALAPRRPLPSTVDQEGPAKEYNPPEPVSAADAADALFMRDDSDIQHGRRNQLKKKPKFDVSEEDLKTASTEESKA